MEPHGRIPDSPLGLYLKYIVAGLIMIGLYLTTRINYLLFHSLVELFSIIVAACVFTIAWHTRRFIKNPYLIFIGLAYLFIGFLDLMHTLAYKGMPIFTDYDYYANQLWIGARFMESLTLVAGFAFLNRESPIHPGRVIVAYTVVTGLLVLSIFYWKIFPLCFVDGVGLTPFKKISEYVICLILIAALVLLRRNKDRFDPNVHRLLVYSLICTIVSELAFTFYVSNYGLSNLAGHYFKLFSFYLIYRAIIDTGMTQPFRLIFRELNAEIAMRKESEEKREKLIAELTQALDEIKTLEGIIPICANCKRIRDDQGYWSQIEAYISSHSEARFSHGICPECRQKLYPDIDFDDDTD